MGVRVRHAVRSCSSQPRPGSCLAEMFFLFFLRSFERGRKGGGIQTCVDAALLVQQCAQHSLFLSVSIAANACKGVCTKDFVQKYSSLAHGISLHTSIWMRGLLFCWLPQAWIVRMRVGIRSIATMRVGTG